MRYYAQYDDDGKLIAIGTGECDTEISKEEYNVLFTQIVEKGELAYKVFKGEISIDEVSVELQKEIQERVNYYKEQEEKIKTLPISAQEFQSIILGEGI